MAQGKERFLRFYDYAVKWAVCAIVFAVPFSKSIGEIAITVSIVLWIARKIVLRDFSFKGDRLLIPLIVLVVSALPSFLNTPLPAHSLKALFTKVMKYAALYLIIVESIDSKSKLQDVCVIALLSVGVILLDGFGQYYYSGVDGLHSYPSFKARSADNLTEGFFRGFPTACFPFPNDLAAWILLVFFPLTCLAIFDLRGKKIRYLVGVLSAGLFYLLFLTKTRAAWIGFAISMAYLAFAKRRLWLILLLVIALAVPFILKMEMAHYIFGLSSMSQRADMWKVGWRIYTDHPLIGNGINTFFRKYTEYRTDQWRGQKGSYAHNCYLQMAADVGLVGLLGFLSFLGAYYLSVVRAVRSMADPFYSNLVTGISVGVFAFLVLAFFDTNLYSLNLVTLFWCAVGITQAAINVSGRDAA